MVHPFRYGPTTLDGPPFVHLLTEKSPENPDPKIHCPDLVRKKRTVSGLSCGLHALHSYGNNTSVSATFIQSYDLYLYLRVGVTTIWRLQRKTQIRK
jgi:hypothetical protein